jgi:hypothetical protein
MHVFASLEAGLPRVRQACLRRSLTSSAPRALPRLAPGSSSRLSASQHAKVPSEEHVAGESSGGKPRSATSTAPPAWFIPKPSSTAPVLRPSFLPPPPRTEPLPEVEVRPPPEQLPEDLRELWVHLHSHPLFKAGSVQFISTTRPAPRTIPILAHPPRNGRRKRGFIDGGDGIGGLEIGGWWDWQVVCIVEGRGPGDVRRGELAVREWVRPLGALTKGMSFALSSSAPPAAESEPSSLPLILRPPLQLALKPLHYKSNVSRVSTKVVRPVKGTPPPEWSQIDTGTGVAINVMTPAASELYDLRGIWADPL